MNNFKKPDIPELLISPENKSCFQNKIREAFFKK